MERSPIDGLSKEANQTLLDRISELERRLEQLELGPPAAGPVTRDVAAVEGQTLNLDPPFAGLTVALPEARGSNAGAQIFFFQRTSNPVRIQAIKGTVNGKPQLISNMAGYYAAVSDGVSGWSLPAFIAPGGIGLPGVPGAPGAPGSGTTMPGLGLPVDDDGPWGFPPVPFQWQDALGAGNHTGPYDVFWDVGRFVNFGLPGAGPGQIRSADANFTIRGDNVAQLSGNTGVIVSSSTASVLISALTTTTLNTGGAPRLRIDNSGAWALAGVAGASGQVPTSSGPGADMVWSTPSGSAPAAPSPPGVAFPLEDEMWAVPAHPFPWSADLGAGNHSGPNNPFIDVGQFLNLGLAGPVTGSPQIRSGDATLLIRGSQGTSVTADASTAFMGSTAADVQLSGQTGISLSTGGASRVTIAGTGEWTIPAGSSGQVWTHRGAGNAPTWQATAASAAPPGLALTVDADELQPGMLSCPLPWSAVLLAGNRSGSSNPTIDSGQFLVFDSFVGVGTGDIRKTGALSARSQTSVEILDTSSLNNVIVSTSGVIVSGDNASGFVDIQSNGTVGTRVSSNGGSGPGHLRIVEDSTSAPTVAAGEGLLWIRSNTPNEAWFTDDGNLDRPLMNSVTGRSTVGTVSAATTALDLCGAYTTAANTLTVGSVMRSEAWFTFTRGATATALNLLITFRVGANSVTTTLTSITTAVVQTFHMVAEFTVLTTGAGGTCSAALALYGATSLGASPQQAGVTNTALACNTTGTLAIAADMQMSVGVAATAISSVGGFTTIIR